MATKTATPWYGNTLQGIQLVEQLPKDVRQLGRDALEQGFEVKRNGDGHLSFRKLDAGAPDPEKRWTVASAPMTPSDWRNAKNFRANLERMGLVTDAAAKVVERGAERRAKREAERQRAQREAERAERRARQRQEEEARQRAKDMAQQMTAEVRDHTRQHAYDDIWKGLLPKFKVLAAIDMADGESGGYDQLYPVVYDELVSKGRTARLSGVVLGLERRGCVEILHKYPGRTGNRANPVTGVRLTDAGRKELAEHVERKRYGKDATRKRKQADAPEPEPEATSNGSTLTPVQLSLDVGSASEVLPLIEALAERLLEALGTETLKNERDELLAKVERLEKRGAFLPNTGRLNEREVEAAQSVVMAMRR